MYFWYKFFTYLFYPIAPIYLFIRRIKKKEDPIRYKEKLSKITKSREEGFLVWFHVASVGEAMSILPLVEYFLEEKKIKKILLTSITLSSGRILEKRYQLNDKITHQFLPLDIPIFTKKFLEHWKPNLSIFIDSEIWPNLISLINKKKIPLILVNGRITEKSFKRWKLVKNFAKKIFSKFDLCITSSKESESFLKELGAKNVKNHGNLKFSQLKKSLNIELNTSFLEKIINRKIWCATSTHPSEEFLCAKAHLKIKENYKNILTIIIPRHINRTEKIKSELSNLNLKIALYSKPNEIKSDTDILIIDSYGETLKFFNITKYVFVGKSLVKNLIKNSGQNPIEPARLGCRILHGPNITNFNEIYSYLKELKVAKVVNNSEELSQSLVDEFKEDKVKSNEITNKIKSYGQNIFDNVTLELKKYI